MFIIDGELVLCLPAARRAPDGTMRTGLSGMTDGELAGIGIYPATVVRPALSEGQYYGAYAVEIEGDHATVTYPVLDYSAAEVAGMLAGAKVAKIAEIQAASDAAIASLESGYTQGEIKSFDRQRQGALDILAGNTTTPDAQYVAALAAARYAAGDSDSTAVWLAQRIKDNADAAATYTIAILGKQQGLEALVRAAAGVAEVEAIEW